MTSIFHNIEQKCLWFTVKPLYIDNNKMEQKYKLKFETQISFE